jgi:hypothetical protein
MQRIWAHTQFLWGNELLCCACWLDGAPDLGAMNSGEGIGGILVLLWKGSIWGQQFDRGDRGAFGQKGAELGKASPQHTTDKVGRRPFN